MKRKLKMVVSTLTVASMLATTVFSGAAFADDENLQELAEVVSAETNDDSSKKADEKSEVLEEAETDENVKEAQEDEASKESTALFADDESSSSSAVEAESFSVWFDDIATDGVIKQQEITHKGSSLKLIGNKSGDDLTDFTVLASAANIVRDGKTVNAYKAGNRNANANDIKTIPVYGDGTALVFKPDANGTVTAYIWSTSFLRVWDFDASETRLGYTDSEAGVESVSFHAEAGHTYVLSTTGKTNNMAYAGLEYVIDEPLNVTVNPWKTPADSSYNFDGTTFNVIDANLLVSAGVIDKNTKNITLSKGHRYIVEPSDAGVGVTFAGEEVLKVDDKTSITLELVEIPDVSLTGRFLTNDGKASDVKSISFVNIKTGIETKGEISKNKKTYTAVLKPGEYNTVVESDGYVTYDRVHIEAGIDNENLVYLESTDTGVYFLPDELEAASSSALEFNGFKANNATSVKASKGGTIVVPVSGEQKVTVSGWYEGTWDINGQDSVTATKTENGSVEKLVSSVYYTNGKETSVTVNATGEGTNYLYCISVENVNRFDENKTTFTVPGDFNTLKEANEYIASLVDRPDGEAGRITIELTANMEEQVVFDQPYVTLDGNGHELTWYYGVGTFYYSIDEKTGLYSDRLFYDKYSSAEGNGSLWGGVAIIRGDNFKAVNTTFRNTYNYWVTEMDAADFEHATGNLPAERTTSTDVATYNAKERSNALYVEAKNIEIENCDILSSQDTFGRNGSADGGYSIYLKNCVIGGNVDYICGNFTAIFDGCELRWKTYSNDTGNNNAKIGYITAAKENPYIFRNCIITTDIDNKEEGSASVAGAFGRTWGSNSNVTFLNTETNGHINKEEAWGQMSASDLTPTFQEYNSTEFGVPFTSKDKFDFGTQITDVSVAAELLSDSVVSDKLSGWLPEGYYDEGDVTADGIITATDASAALQKSRNDDYVLPYEKKTNRDALKVADVDEDYFITASDAQQILRKSYDADYEYKKLSK